MSELKGIVNTKAKLKGTINTSVKQKGVVSVGGTLIGAEMARRGLKGEKGDTGDTGATGVGISSIAKTGTAGKVDTYTITYTDGNTATFDVTNGQDGDDGADGFSPIANVTKVGDTATITITDEDGTTTASISDGVDGQDGADGYSPSASVSKVGSTATITITDKDGTTTASISDGDINVQSDWNEADTTADDYIKNKPTIPSKTSDLNNDSGFITSSSLPSNLSDLNNDMDVSDFPNDAGYITGYTETDPVFTASDAYGITSSDISNWNGKSDFSGSYNDLTDKPTIPTVNNATLTIQKNGTLVDTFTANASSNVTANIPVHDVPSGGTSGQVLAKDSNDDYDLAWITVSGGGGDVVYATSGDSASTVAKTATIVSGTLTTLTSGVQAIVKFAATNTASSPTLNVGSTGAKSIKRYGTTAVGQNQNESWVAGSPVLFVYDGTNWVIAGWLNTTYSGGTASGITTGTDNLNYIWSPKQIHDGITGLSSKVQIVRWT